MENKTNIIDLSLTELIQEADTLFQKLNHISTSISTLEKELTRVKAFFPFKLLVDEEKRSLQKRLMDNKSDLESDNYYFTTVSWHLAWEEDENSKNYRLFLISEALETVATGFEEHYSFEDVQINKLFKKPFIETNLKTRLKYSEYLITFIDSFKTYLKDYRISIEKNDLPF